LDIINRNGRKLILGRFLELDENDIRRCDSKLTSLPPANNKIDRANMALAEGIPFEYLVDTGIIIDKDDVGRLSISTDGALEIGDYIRYKKNPKSLEKVMVYVITNDLDELQSFTEKLSVEKVEFGYVTGSDDLDEILSDESLVEKPLNFVITENISTELVEITRELHKSLLEAELKFTFIDLMGILNITEGVFKLHEYTDKISKLIQNEKYTVLRNISDDSETNSGEKIIEIDKNGDDSSSDEKENTGEVTGEVTGEIQEENVEKVIEETVEVHETVENKDLALAKNKTEEELQQEKENGEAILEAVRNELKTKYERQINSLEEEIQLKLKNIDSLNNRLKTTITNYNDELEKNKDLRDKMQEIKKEINETREANAYLKETKVEYDRIIGDYRRLISYEKENENKIDEIINDYTEKINGYTELIGNYEKDIAEIKEEYDKLILVSNAREPSKLVNYLTTVETKIIYFNMIDELLYFNTIISALYSKLKSKSKVLIILIKDLRPIEREDYSDWGTLENPKDKILIKEIDIKAVKLIEDISKEYDYIIALDYACEDRMFIKSTETDIYDVVKNKKRQEKLGYNNILISPTDDSFIDIKFDEKVYNKKNSVAKKIYIKINKGIEKFFAEFEKRDKAKKEELKRLIKEEGIKSKIKTKDIVEDLEEKDGEE